jgi:hypothetical protein
MYLDWLMAESWKKSDLAVLIEKNVQHKQRNCGEGSSWL